MFTPQEVQSQKFEKAVFGGYDMAAVDEFLEQLTVDYATLYKENAVLKNKLKVLVDSLEEYRSVDDSMRKALLSAQKMASQTVEEAKRDARKIVEEAEGSASARKRAAAAEAEEEERRLREAKRRTAAFLLETKRRYQQQLDALERIPEIKVDEPAAAPAASPVADAAEEIGNIVALKIQQEQEPAAEEEITKTFEPETPSLEETKTRIDFGTLQFGDNYSKPQE